MQTVNTSLANIKFLAYKSINRSIMFLRKPEIIVVYAVTLSNTLEFETIAVYVVTLLF